MLFCLLLVSFSHRSLARSAAGVAAAAARTGGQASSSSSSETKEDQRKGTDDDDDDAGIIVCSLYSFIPPSVASSQAAARQEWAEQSRTAADLTIMLAACPRCCASLALFPSTHACFVSLHALGVSPSAHGFLLPFVGCASYRRAADEQLLSFFLPCFFFLALCHSSRGTESTSRVEDQKTIDR